MNSEIALPSKMATSKLAKVDLLVFISIALAVVISLRLGAKFTKLIQTRKENATNECASNDHVSRTTERRYGWHEGYDDDGDDNNRSYPFFFWYYNKLGSFTGLTAQKAVEQELEMYANVLGNSPSIISKEDQAEHDIVISSVCNERTKPQVILCCSF